MSEVREIPMIDVTKEPIVAGQTSVPANAPSKDKGSVVPVVKDATTQPDSTQPEPVSTTIPSEEGAREEEPSEPERREQEKSDLEKIFEEQLNLLNGEDRVSVLRFLTSTENTHEKIIDGFDEKLSLIDSLVELKRYIYLLVQLIMLLIFSQLSGRDTISGKEFVDRLQIDPPEGKEEEQLSMRLLGQTGSSSWAVFRQRVAEIGEKKIPEFIAEVLSLNSTYAAQGVRPKEIGELQSSEPKKTLRDLAKGYIARKAAQVTRASLAKAA